MCAQRYRRPGWSPCPFCEERSADPESLYEHIRSDHLARLPCNPIVHVDSSTELGGNINGPSLIRVPEWVENPLGTYYLYFAHHSGAYIRLAYADHLDGPWKVHEPGTLQLEESGFKHHIASPDVYVDDKAERIRMYFHGRYAYTDSSSMILGNVGTILRRSVYINARRALDRLHGSTVTLRGWRPKVPSGIIQHTRVATSSDGLNFSVEPGLCGMPYFRVFRYKNRQYALAMPGIFYRSIDEFHDFEPGPVLFSANMRHAAVQVCGDILRVFYSRAGDRPERILLSQVSLQPDWNHWNASDPVTVLKPEREYEGGNYPIEESTRGATGDAVRQARDPAVFTENGTTYLLYSVAGERGIAIAKVIE